MPGKKKLRKFWNEKARASVFSVVIVASLLISAFTGLFLLSGQAEANEGTLTSDWSDVTHAEWYPAAVYDPESSYIWIFGGKTSDTFLDLIEKVNTSTAAKTTSSTSLPTAAYRMCAVLDTSNDFDANYNVIWLFGGAISGGYSNTIQVFYPHNETLQSKGTLPQDCGALSGFQDSSGVIWLFGGENASSTMGVVWKFYPSNQTVVQYDTLSVPLAYAPVIYGDGFAYIFGGLDTVNSVKLDNITKYNLTTKAESVVGNLTAAIYGSAAAFDGGNLVYIAGGNDASGTRYDDIQKWNISTGGNTVVVNNLTNAVYGLACANDVDDHTAYFIAGKTASSFTSNIDKFVYPAASSPSNQPPTCSISSPSNGATVSGTVSITGTASDSDGTVQSVQVKIGSDAWATASGTTSWSYSWDTTGYSDGSYTILARSYDGTDYSTNASITVTVDNTPDVTPSVALSGLTSGKITWNGTAPGTYWCNATGAGHETLEIVITGGSGANDTDVTQINITVPADLTNGSNTIDPSNITLYVSVDNSTFHSMGAFPTNGGTIVMNATTWTWTDDPFPIAGDDNIYCRFKITYADGQAAGNYTKTGVTVEILG